MKRSPTVDPTSSGTADPAPASSDALPGPEPAAAPVAAVDAEAIPVGDPTTGFEAPDWAVGEGAASGQPGPAVWGETSTSLAAGSPLTEDDLEAALERMSLPPETGSIEAPIAAKPASETGIAPPTQLLGDSWGAGAFSFESPSAPAVAPPGVEPAEPPPRAEPSGAPPSYPDRAAPETRTPADADSLLGQLGSVRELSATPELAPATTTVGAPERVWRGHTQPDAPARADEQAVAQVLFDSATDTSAAADSPPDVGPNLGWLQTARTGRSRWTDELKWPRRLPTTAVRPVEIGGGLAALLRRALAAAGSLTTEVVVFTLISRLVLAGIGWLSLRAIDRLDRYPGQLADSFFPNHAALDGWARWDAAHYIAIASQGYAPTNPSPGDGAGFLPLYPMLMRGAVELTGREPTPVAVAVAGLIIANLAFLLAAPLLARLTASRFGEAAGRNAAMLLCLSPLSFFFSAGYSESLFLLLALASLSLAGGRRWAWAAVAAGLASGTRLAGLALTPALLVQAHRNRADREELALIALVAPGGAVLYFFYSAITFGDPFAYFRAQATWRNGSARRSGTTPTPRWRNCARPPASPAAPRPCTGRWSGWA